MLWEFLLFASFPSGPPPSVDKEDEIEIAIQEQIQDADCKEAEVKLPSPADYTGSLERFSESRRAHFKMCVLRGLQEVAQIRDQLETLKECREEQENELELLTSLKTSALQNPHTARKASNLSTAIKNLQKAYSQNQKQLYKLKRERSISEAKVDRFVSKLNQGMEYVELYATCSIELHILHSLVEFGNKAVNFCLTNASLPLQLVQLFLILAVRLLEILDCSAQIGGFTSSVRILESTRLQ